MLGVGLLIALWIVLGLGTFLIAMTDGSRRARPKRGAGSTATRVTTYVFTVIFAGFGLAIPIALLSGNHANASSQFDGIRLNAGDKEGRILFGQHCAVCHTLAAANAVGKVGLNLDALQPPKSLVLSTVKNGLTIGHGTMPQGLVVGKDAVDVADFVSKVAGK